ncbi:MAG: UPF0182 family protein [Tuberibacillus sp.]
MDFKKVWQERKLRTPGRKRAKIIYFFIFLIIIIAVGRLAISLITDFTWMKSVGFSNVYMTILWTKVLLAGIGFLLFAGTLFITLFWIWRTYMKEPGISKKLPLFLTSGKTNLIIAAVSIVFGLLGSSMAQGFGWERWLKLIHQTPFNKTDPFFHLDISFYLFVLPFLEFVVTLLIGLSIFLLALETAAYVIPLLIFKSRRAQWHFAVTLGLTGLFLAVNHVLGVFETLLTDRVSIFQKSAVYGLSYTDRYINIPKEYVLAAFSIIGAIWIMIAIRKHSIRRLITPMALYIGLAVVGQLASIVVQQFIVSPNEFSKEKPYLKHNIDFTKTAYELNNIKEKQHPGNLSLTRDMLDRNELTVDSIRINDARPLVDVYNQLQTFRTYYQFKDVDIDRYMVDGKYQQVFLGARELSTDDLPDQAQTWTNKNLRYTHGYGISMSHVNQITEQGQPEYMVNNLPPKGSVKVTRPQIYFGEEKYDSVVVDSNVSEFDYPAGETNVNTKYKADDAGIPLTGFNRVWFALKEKDLRILVSNQISAKSQLLETRNIMDRLERIAPFFTYDEDPYMVVRDDGSLVWIVDAYLTEKNYPYSEPFSKDLNYISNPVKAVVDAYTGRVTFYVVEPDNAVLQTYRDIFPNLFTDKVPDDIRAHFRYPLTLFKTQAEMYGTYHMSNLEVFYNREDYWQFPTEKYYNDDVTMEPYYVTMKLPDEDKEEFVLMMPYTPKNKQNMIAWMGVRNDGEHYGEKLVYRFPKQKNIYGPQQIENRINQNSEISQQLNLWSQGGSKVIRGNLLVIPIEDTLLYVEPIYIESSNETSLPEVKRIVVAYGDKIVMEPTLEQSLDELLSLIDPEQSAETPPGEDGNAKGEEPNGQPETGAKADEKLKQLAQLFKDYKKAVSESRWEDSGKIMDEIEKLLGQ